MTQSKHLLGLCLDLIGQRITLEDVAILAHLANVAESTDYAGIATACRINPMTLRRYVKSLRDRGFIQRVEIGTDRRFVGLAITTEGREFLATICRALSSCHE